MSPESPSDEFAERSLKLAEMAKKLEENGVDPELVAQLQKKAEQLTKDAVQISRSDTSGALVKPKKHDRGSAIDIDYDDDGIPF